jgi:hypothetical protein
MDKITIGSDQYKTIWNDEKYFYIHITPQTLPMYTDYREALLRAVDARHYYEPVVLVSGGLDSEVVAAAVHEHGAPYTLLHVEYRYHGQLFNSHERYWVERLAGILGKPLEILTLNFETFYETDQYLTTARSAQCASPQLAAHLWALTQLDRPVILGGSLRQAPGDSSANSSFHACYRQWRSEEKQGCELLQDTYELYALSLKLPSTVGQVKDRTAVGKMKQHIYNSWGFHFPFEDRPKHTGFELIQQQHAVMGVDWNQLYRTDTLMRQVPHLHTRFV